MTNESLKYIQDVMKKEQVPYEFKEWSSDIVYPYFVGDYTEPQYNVETGLQESSFFITGTTKGTYSELENFKQKIKKAFNVQTVLPNGNGLAIVYGGCLNIPTGNAEMKRIQINLNIKEWEV